jgi:hypothetical protein
MLAPLHILFISTLLFIFAEQGFNRWHDIASGTCSQKNEYTFDNAELHVKNDYKIHAFEVSSQVSSDLNDELFLSIRLSDCNGLSFKKGDLFLPLKKNNYLSNSLLFSELDLPPPICLV